MRKAASTVARTTSSGRGPLTFIMLTHAAKRFRRTSRLQRLESAHPRPHNNSLRTGPFGSSPVVSVFSKTRYLLQELSSTQAYRGPIRCHGHPRLRRVVENQHQGPSLLSTGDGKLHWLTARHDYVKSFSPHLFAQGGFEACFSAFGVPDFRPRVPMQPRLHSRIHDRFHVLCRVFCICVYRERADFRNALTT